jgi:hypothetical protein
MVPELLFVRAVYEVVPEHELKAYVSVSGLGDDLISIVYGAIPEVDW